MRSGSIVVAAALLAAGVPAAAQGQETVVKMATLAPDGSRWHLILKETAEKWRALSGGRVAVRLYPGGVAGDDADMVRKMRLGTLSAAVLTAAGLAEIEPSVSALDLPLAYDSYDEVYWVLDRMRPRLEAGLEKNGFVVLNWADGGWTRFFTQKPVVVPDDLRALKLFTWAGDAKALAVWKAVGFEAVALPGAELGTALQSGQVSAVAVSPQIAVISQCYTSARNMTEMPWQLLLGATLITKAAWDKVPAETRPALLAAAQDAGKRLRDEMRASGEKDVLEMKKRGLNVVPVNAKAREAWKKTAEGAWPRLRGEVVPAVAFDEALRLRDEYRKLPASSR